MTVNLWPTSRVPKWPKRKSYKGKNMKVEVDEHSATTKRSKAGNLYTVQKVWLHLPGSNGRATPVEYFVPSGSDPLKPGTYALDVLASLAVREGRLAVGELVFRSADAVVRSAPVTGAAK